MSELSIVQSKTREERDREGFANAYIVDSDEEAPPDDPPMLFVAAAKRVKVEKGGSASASAHNLPWQRPANALPPTRLPIGGAFSSPARSATRGDPHAGHLLFSISAPAGQPAAIVGVGDEIATQAYMKAVTHRLSDGTIACDDSWGSDVLHAIERLANPSLNKARKSLVYAKWNPPLPWSLEPGTRAPVRLDVWLGDDIFDIKISSWLGASSCFFEIWQVFERLEPTEEPAPLPRAPPVLGAVALVSAPSAAAARNSSYAFTLAGLMRAMESAGYAEAPPPDALQMELYQYQRQSLQWMLDRETLPHGLNSLFWREYPGDRAAYARRDDTFWYNPMAGELRYDRPRMVSGGFLCEEMGLGKTIECVALILANPWSGAKAAAFTQADVDAKRLVHVVADGWNGAKVQKQKEADVLPVYLTDDEVEVRPASRKRPYLVVDVGDGAVDSSVVLVDSEAADPQKAPRLSILNPPQRRLLKSLLATGTTLIVCPVSILDQWREEIRKASGDTLSVRTILRSNALLRQQDVGTAVTVTCKQGDPRKNTLVNNTAVKWPISTNPPKPGKYVVKSVEGGAEGLVGGKVEMQSTGADAKPIVFPNPVHNVRAEELVNLDIVLTTYDKLKSEASSTDKYKLFHRLHWWRVVLDESQNCTETAVELARSCSTLSRMHSWLMSGTPASSVVDNLLGQLIFLGVEPYAQRGTDGDAFWEREVTARWKAKDPDALQVVQDLLGQVMMRHSKAQTHGPNGEPIVKLPQMTQEVVRLTFGDSDADIPEKYTYLALEAFCRAELERGAAQARRGAGPQTNLGNSQHLAPTVLQHAATHVSTLNLELLEIKLQSARAAIAGAQLEAALASRQLDAVEAAITFAQRVKYRDGQEHKLERAKQLRERLRQAGTAARKRPRAQPVGEEPRDDARRTLAEVVAALRSSADAQHAAAAEALQAVIDEAARRCIICQQPLGTNGTLLLTPCCHLFCAGCLGQWTGEGDVEGAAAAGATAAVRGCPSCRAPISVGACEELQPLASGPSGAGPSGSARPSGSSGAGPSSAAPPPPALPPLDPKTQPAAGALARLRVYRCAGATPNPAGEHLCPDGGMRERPVTVLVDGLHFCSSSCAQKRFKAHLRVHADRHCELSSEWPGKGLRGTRYETQAAALKELQRLFTQVVSGSGGEDAGAGSSDSSEPGGGGGSSSTGGGSATYDGEPLYPKGKKSRSDPRLPQLHDEFPPNAPDGSFLAHYDAAGGLRPYGLHWGPSFPVGTKLRAVLNALVAMRRADGSSKCVVFSGSERALDVLHEALRHEAGAGGVGWGDGGLARIRGSSKPEERSEALRKFQAKEACRVLLLPVQACATGLTLTAADHCFLLELQYTGRGSGEMQEAQLVNRIWRIGQSKPVTVRRFVMAGTVEERMLELRNKSGGVLAGEQLGADSLTVPQIASDADGEAQDRSGASTSAAAPATGAAVVAERAEDLRYLFGAPA